MPWPWETPPPPPPPPPSPTLDDLPLPYQLTGAALLVLLVLELLLRQLRQRRPRPKRKAAPTALSHDRIRDEPLAVEQRAQWEALAAVAQGFKDKEDVLRALFTCRFDGPATVKLLKATVAWREKYRPELIQPADLPNSLPTRCWCPGGLTKQGWPILECYVRRWRPFDYDLEEQHRLIGFFFHLALGSHPGAERFCILFDMSGWSLALGMPQPLLKVFAMISIAQNEFCERLGAVYLVNVPLIFRATWAILEPLIHERVAPRVFFCGEDWKQQVLRLVDEDQLPEGMGGRRKETPVV